MGVSHQYCGQLGKQANCQVSVSLSLAIEAASVPVDYRLYLPKSWSESMPLRKKTGVPQDVVFQSKPQIALEQLARAVERLGTDPIVVADAGYGNADDFLAGIDALGLQYMVGVQTSTLVWAPWTTPQAQRAPQWLLIEWPRDEPEPTKFWLGTLSATASKRQLVRVAKIRLRIERDYQELKDELGLNQYEGRNWRGFHHHASLCIAAYGFLVLQRL